jgi:hypothetical protein
MLKVIVTAIVAALKAIGGFARRVAAAPFAALASAFGSGVDQSVVPTVAPSAADGDDEEPAPGPNLDAVYKELANIVMTWAADSIVDGQPGPLPSPRPFPRGIAEWLHGISLDEAHVLINASEAEVCAHLRSRELIPGLRSVRPLDPVAWPEEPRPYSGWGSPEFVSCDAGYAPAR